jgi:hypothetical protein
LDGLSAGTTGTASKWRVRYAKDRLAGFSETGNRVAKSNDPEFAAKAAGIVWLYMAPLEYAIVLAVVRRCDHVGGHVHGHSIVKQGGAAISDGTNDIAFG